MRLLSLRFKNLNSLEGEWNIDFTHSEYGTQGLFAITGPTGAGKSTLLDAISLALYGRTPRLERITASQNEIMSRHTGECFAEVCFETHEGQFRVHWAQHRARKQAQGELQPPRHEIAKAECGTVLAHQLRRVAPEVERLTGMDFDRFTRSMLLAQGNFAAFLQADADQRAPILEQITGTEIYSDISILTHERYSSEKNTLQALEQALAHIELLAPEQEQQIRLELLTLKNELQEVDTQLAQNRKKQQRFEELEQQKQTLAELEQRGAALQTQQHNFTAQDQHLEQAEKAAQLEKDYYALNEKRREHQNLALQVKAQIQQLSLQKTTEQLHSAQREQAALDLQKKQTHWQEQRPILQKTRELDAERARLQTLAAQKTISQQQAHTQFTEKEKQLGQLKASLDQGASELGQKQLYLQQHQVDAGLVEQLGAIEQRYEQLVGLQQEHTQKQHQVQLISERVTKIKADLAKQTELLEPQQSRLEAAKANCERYQQQFTQHAEGRSLSQWYQQIQSLQEQSHFARAHLELHQDLHTVEQQQIEITQTITDYEEQEQKAHIELTQLHTRLEQQESLCHTLEKLLAAEQRIVDLEQERTRLEQGSPCPLCGSSSHPYVEQGVSAELNKTQIALQDAQLIYKELQQQSHVVQLQEARAQEQAKACQEQLLQLQQSQKQRWAQFALRFPLQAAKLEKPPTLKHLESELLDCQQRLDAAEKHVEVLATLQEQLESSQKQVEQEKLRLNQLENEQRLAAHELTLQEQQAQTTHNEAMQGAARIQQLDALIWAQCEPYITVNRGGLSEWLPQLRQRQQNWLAQQQQEQMLQRKVHQLEQTVANIRLQCAQLHATREQSKKDCEQIQAQLKELTKQRQQLLADELPDEVEQGLELAYQTSQKEYQQALLLAQEQALAVERLRTDLEKNQQSTTLLEAQWQELEQDFAQRLEQLGFKDEAHYIQAVLTAAQIQQLRQQKNALERESALWQSQHKECAEKVRLLSADLQFEDKTELLDLLQQQQHTHNEFLQYQGRLEAQLSTHQAKATQAQTQLQTIALQKRELQKWAQLRDLIGSADGKKFRNFAQGLTFDRMVQQANQQLRAMQDRYLLLRDPVEPLVLNVMDNYQAGEVRSTKNLSGGESFIISLALALGLSQMASQNVRLDSLFLDEGFGTLDEDALDVALDTLASLHQDGKLIGVISHVPALKERISTQIQVLPMHGGRSRLLGPGCEQT